MIQAKLIAPRRVARYSIIALMAVFIAGIFAMGFDQGHMFSIVEGATAYDTMYLHELSHDMRHAAGFPCH